MDLITAFLADELIERPHGLNDAKGIGRNTFRLARVPGSPGTLHFFAWISASLAEVGTHAGSLRLADADGRTIFDAPGPVPIVAAQDGAMAESQFHVPFTTTFPALGDYELLFLVDHEIIWRMMLHVRPPLAKSS